LLTQSARLRMREVEPPHARTEARVHEQRSIDLHVQAAMLGPSVQPGGGIVALTLREVNTRNARMHEQRRVRCTRNSLVV
jgi:hypothetical protein